MTIIIERSSILLLLFYDWNRTLFPEEPKKPERISQNQAYFWTRVDYNLKNISSQGSTYIYDLLENLFKTVIHSPERFTDVGFYLRVEREIKKCSIFERKKIVEMVDTYLPRPHLQESKEREFFMRIRNIAFIQVQKELHPERYL